MITTDTGAKKIEATDNWRQIFGAHNDTVDAYDANIEALQDALGIVVDGNQSAVSASSGQFIILKNSSIVDSGDVMLADGLYTAAKAIPANTTIDKTYLTADAAGGLNALNSKINQKTIVDVVKSPTTSSGTLIDTGVSVTIPAGSLYAISWGLSYANHAPQEIVVTSGAASATYDRYAESTTSFSGVTTAGYAKTALTLKLYGKWGGSSVNGAWAYGWYEPAVK